MAIPNIIDYFETDASNVDISGIGLSNATLIDQLDDIARAQMGALARFTGADTIASAATTSIGTLPGMYVEVTGTTTITSLGPAREGIIKFLRFNGVLTLTHNATSLILKGGASRNTVAGDTGVYVSLGSGNWVELAFDKASGEATVPPVIPASAGKLDVRRNRIVNHDMRVSQENGTTSGTTNGYHPVDQWAEYFVTSAGTLTVAQVASVTPAGSPNRLRATVTTADASLAAGEFWTLRQNLEGSNVADFQYGGAAAKNAVLRFGFKGPAGTYAAALHNSAANRSYVALFTISAPQANTDTVQTVSIAGDVTGTWLTADGVIGITLDIVLAAGTTFQGAAGWQAGNILATSAISNGMGTGAAVFELFDVGLRLDPDATGVYGQYEVGEEHPKWRTERYLKGLTALPVGITLNSTFLYSGVVQCSMAKTPSLVAGATYTVSNGSAGTVVLSSGAGGDPSKDGVAFQNGSANWSANALVSVTALLSARLS